MGGEGERHSFSHKNRIKYIIQQLFIKNHNGNTHICTPTRANVLITGASASVIVIEKEHWATLK